MVIVDDRSTDNSLNLIQEAAKQVVRESGLASCYIRPIAYYGYGEMGLATTDCKVDVAIACWPWGAYLGEDAATKGVRMKISSWVRHDHNIMPPASKTTGNYANSTLAKTLIGGRKVLSMASPYSG